ncbi:helix-turn-helix domain-containing protein [Nitrospirillum sp. BR 11828]|uniref:helix-turn-helix domain-containing protein n=1 Tax=Nitrospirillum sp. BR 11828 TaxID=3104325 RepID=UPI003A0FC206
MSRDEFVALRKSLGRTQEDLAHDLGKRVRQIARYESGEVPIPAPVAQALKELVQKR